MLRRSEGINDLFEILFKRERTTNFDTQPLQMFVFHAGERKSLQEMASLRGEFGKG